MQSAADIRRVLQESDISKRADWTGVGIGIASGPVFVGSLGSEVFKDYTVIGNTVNIAARLCGLARKFQVLYPEQAHNLTAGASLPHRKIGRARLKGLSAPIPIYELIDA